jgi:hypothetical protein
VPATTQRNDLDEFIDNLSEKLIPNLAGEIEEQSVFNATSTHAAPRVIGSDPIRSKDQHTQFPFGLQNAATVYQKTMWFESLSALEEDLDHLQDQKR